MVKDYPKYSVPSITSIQDMLLRSAKEYSNKLALEDLNDTPISNVTFKQLNEYVIRFGKALFDIGIKERDHIAVISENRVQWSLTYFTTMCFNICLLYTSDAADERSSVDLGGRRILKKKNKTNQRKSCRL